MPLPRSIAAATALALTLLTTACDRGDKPHQLGTPAPNFTVTDATHSVSLAQFRGHVVLLNFWASWCAPCLEELPSMETLSHTLPQVQVLGVSIDTDSGAYNSFLRLHHVDFLTVIDPEGKANGAFGTYRPPETYVIDKQGLIRRKFIGPQNWTSPEITDYLKKLAAS